MTYTLEILKKEDTFEKWHSRHVLEHSSTCLNHVKIHEDELLKISVHPSDMYDHSKTTITYQFITGIFLVRTSKT